MLETVITLIEYDRAVVGADIKRTEKEKYDLIASERSVGMKEKYEALNVGLQIERVFVISDYLDYKGQKNLIHEAIEYEVIRTFRKENSLEIYVTR